MRLLEMSGYGRSMLKAVAFVAVLLMGSCVHEPFGNQGFEDEGGPGNPSGTPAIPGCVSNGDICFESSVLPIFLSSCAKSGCHNAQSREEGIVLDSYANIMKKGIVPGNARESELYKVLFQTGEDRMPPDGALSQAQKDSIAAWINQGAKNTTNCNCACDTARYTYAAVIQPILTNNCVGCHKPGALSVGIDLSTYTSVKTQVANGKLWGSVSHATGYSPMPQGGKLSDCQISQISKWIDAGAPNN